jgi:ribosomal protein S18 acetylase RimI-like enzyme
MLSGMAQPDLEHLPAMSRASAFARETTAATAQRVLELEGGVAVFHDDLASVWDLNLLWLDAVSPDATAESLAALAETIQGAAGLAHRKIAITDETAGARLVEGFTALGWTVSVFVYMALARAPERRGAADVREADEPGQRALRERILREFPDADSDDVLAQLVDVKRATAAAVPTRWFAAYADGEPVSVGELYVAGDTAQIEDLATLTAYRNRGLASAVVLRAIEEARGAGAELVFLIADEEDWPKQLYGRLGFDPIGRTYSFLRKPNEAS